MHALAVEWLSLKETGADNQENQRTAEENPDCCSVHEILLQNKVMMIVCSLLIESRGSQSTFCS